MSSLWENFYAQRTRLLRPSSIRELLKVTQVPDVISFAGGLPAPELLPSEEVADATAEVLRSHGTQALQYGPTEGYLPLRTWIADQLSTAEMRVTPENILITTGSQQALDLLARVFFDPGDALLVESPTYMGALHVWSIYDVRYGSVPLDEQGLQVACLEEHIRQRRPKMIYVLPTFQNPSGITLSLERRARLIELVERSGLLVLEDDAYAQLRYEGKDLPSLLRLAGQAAGGFPDRVFHVGTFSKVLAPGMRLGWIAAPREVTRKLVMAKQGTDLHTPMFTQIIASTLLSQGYLERQTPRIVSMYRERRDVMLAALERHFPAQARWTRPEGGMFIWVTLPEGVDSTDLLQKAREQGVIFVPGRAFHATGEGTNTLRLSFSNSEPERIETGIKRLGQALDSLV
ncbi:MAG TPA: PLP-dependent aminotransferase family protein [Ktedonobacteraceae bacterium]|nr:PLP-dependent aminotransferase family protein [Ktedonobacteraceae bacterium]